MMYPAGGKLAAEGDAGAAPIVVMLHFMSGPAASTAEMPGPATDGVQRIQAVDRAIVLLKAVATS